MEGWFILSAILFLAIAAFIFYCKRRERKPSVKAKKDWYKARQGELFGDLLQLIVWLFFC